MRKTEKKDEKVNLIQLDFLLSLQPRTLLLFRGLFNSAYLAFGPHGTGLSNVLWMQSTCEQLPAVIEFICSRGTANVRGCFPEREINYSNHTPRPMTYWRLYGGASWIRYFLVWLLRRYDYLSDFAQVDLNGFEIALNKALDFLGPAAGPLQ